MLAGSVVILPRSGVTFWAWERGYCAVSGEVKSAPPTASGVRVTRHPWEGCCGVPRG